MKSRKLMSHRGVKIGLEKNNFRLKSQFPKGYGTTHVEISHYPRGSWQFVQNSGNILVN